MATNGKKHGYNQNGYKQMYVATAVCLVVMIAVIVILALAYNAVNPNDTSVDADLSRGENSLPPVISDVSIYTVSEEPANEDYINYVELSVQNTDIRSGSLVLVTATGKEPTETLLDLKQIYAKMSDSYGLSTAALYLNNTAIDALNKFVEAFENDVGYNKDKVLINDAYTDFATLTAKERLTSYPDLASGYSVRMGITNAGTYKMGEGKYLWLEENAYRYGFILRYPSDKEAQTGVAASSTCYRYVGTAHSVYIKNNNMTLDEYIVAVKKHDYKNPIRITYGDVIYKVYYTPALENASTTLVYVPSNYPYEISGNNVDGFIVTVTEQDRQ